MRCLLSLRGKGNLPRLSLAAISALRAWRSILAVAIGHPGGVLCLVAMTLVWIILCRPAQHTFTSSMGVQIVCLAARLTAGTLAELEIRPVFLTSTSKFPKPSCATVDLEGVSQNPALLTVHLWILCLACRARRRGQFAASHVISCRSLAYNHQAGLASEFC